MTALRRIAWGIGLAAVAGVSAFAQQGIPNALQGFSQNRDKPVQIEAASLEVRDKDKVATFIGNVNVVQGDTTMRCKSLLVFYDQENKAGAMKAAKPGPGGQQSIRRLEARGGVIVTQKEQTATGDTGIFDMKSNTITLAGNVVVTHGQNILRGDRLVVDMTTGAARVESGKGRVQGLFVPSSTDKPAGKEPAREPVKDVRDRPKEAEPAPAARPAPSAAQERVRPVAPRGIY